MELEEIFSSEAPDDVSISVCEAECDSNEGEECSFTKCGPENFDVAIVVDDETASRRLSLPGAPPIISWGVDATAAGDRAELLRKIKSLASDFFSRGYFKTFIYRRKFFSSVLDNLKDGIIVHDNERLIWYINAPACEITGYSVEDVVGKYCQDIFPGGFCGGKCQRESGWSNCPGSYTLDFRTKDGALKQLEMSVIHMMDDGGEKAGVIASFRDRTKIYELEKRLGDVTGYEGIVGKHFRMQQVFDAIRDLSDTTAPVLIQGETGTGKELVAQAIHNASARAQNLFVPVNCGALPEGIIESELFGHVKGAFTGAVRDKKGRFEMANGGTIFLDEVAELPPHIQVKLLRVLQEGTFERVGGEESVKVDVRVVSATNRDLQAMMRSGDFREDLYYRLCVVPITLPALRDRKNDIPLLAELFLQRFAPERVKGNLSMDPEYVERLIDYPWPGNVRQLQNAIQYSLVKARDGALSKDHLPPEIQEYFNVRYSGGKPGRKLLLTEDVVLEALRKTGGNKAKAARLLNVGRATLYRFLDSSGINV